MKFVTDLRTMSLGVAAASLLLAGSALAQQKYDLVGVNAELGHGLSSQKAVPGEVVEAKLTGSAKTPEGVDLPKGTELRGHVDQVQPSAGNSPARVSIVFSQAQLKDGTLVPVKVVLLGAFPASNGLQGYYGNETMGPAPKHISSREQIDQEPGILSGIAMKSAVHGQDSATFTKDDGNFSLRAGTRFQLGIAPRETGAMSNGAE